MKFMLQKHNNLFIFSQMRHKTDLILEHSRLFSSIEGVSISRRSFLAAAAWGTAAVLMPGSAAAARPLPGVREVSFHNLHTDELLTAVYCEDGEYVPAALEEIDAILRDHRTGEICQISPRLIDLVFALKVRLGSTGLVQVISGYRSPATNALLRAEGGGGVAERSLHLTGEAVDLRFEDRSLRQVRDAALALRGGGVGYYPNSGFVHVDVGRLRRW
jgi:uncharacterized protein YcbK (DUF882 family)